MAGPSVSAPVYVGRFGAPATLTQILTARAEASPDAEFIRFAGERLTYAGALTRARAAAAVLAACGVGKGDTLAVMLENSIDFVILWLGSATLGAVLVPVNPQLRGEGLRYILGHSGAKVAIIEAKTLEDYRSALAAGPGPSQCYVRHWQEGMPYRSLQSLLAGAHPAPRRIRVAPGDPAAVLYTSGTTGLPKGVMTSHNAYIASGYEYAQRYVAIRADDVLWTCLPLFHINAQALSVVPSLLTGRPLVMTATFSASRFLAEMRAQQVTVFNYIGAMLTILLKQPVREDDASNPVRLTAGSSAPRDRWREFERRFGIELIEIYGLTETAGVALASRRGDNPPGTCGMPVSWSAVEIHRPDGTEAAHDEPGEFVVRAHRPDVMFTGYYHDEAATAAANEGGWFHTGDRGVRTADGHFRFVDRLKDSIRRRGENISSFEVERVVNTHPEVLETAAVGVPSELGEEEVLIVVVPRPGSTLDPGELSGYLEDRLAAFQLPRYVRVCTELPKTPTQKVQKFAVREQGVAGAWDRLAITASGRPCR